MNIKPASPIAQELLELAIDAAAEAVIEAITDDRFGPTGGSEDEGYFFTTDDILEYGEQSVFILASILSAEATDAAAVLAARVNEMAGY